MTYVVRCAYWYAVVLHTSTLIENVTYLVRPAYWCAVVPRTSTLIKNVTYVELPNTAYWYTVENNKDNSTVPF